MKISEVIEKLQEMKDQHGDLEFGYYNAGFDSYDQSRHILFRVAERKHVSGQMTGKFNDDLELGDEFIGVS